MGSTWRTRITSLSWQSTSRLRALRKRLYRTSSSSTFSRCSNTFPPGSLAGASRNHSQSGARRAKRCRSYRSRSGIQLLSVAPHLLLPPFHGEHSCVQTQNTIPFSPPIVDILLERYAKQKGDTMTDATVEKMVREVTGVAFEGEFPNHTPPFCMLTCSSRSWGRHSKPEGTGSLPYYAHVYV